MLVVINFSYIDPWINGHLKEGVYPDFNYEKSLHNWIVSMNLYWNKPIETSLFGALYFTGVIVGMAILAFTSKFGRRINLVYSTVINWVSIYTLVLINNIYSKYFGMFVMGIWSIGLVQSYIIATEISPKRLQIIVTCTILGVDVLTSPIWSLYYKFISNEWDNITYAILVITTIMTIAIFFVPESPLFLYEKGEYEAARKIVSSMARINGSPMKNQNWRFDKEEALTSNTYLNLLGLNEYSIQV